MKYISGLAPENGQLANAKIMKGMSKFTSHLMVEELDRKLVVTTTTPIALKSQPTCAWTLNHKASFGVYDCLRLDNSLESMNVEWKMDAPLAYFVQAKVEDREGLVSLRD